MLSVAAITTLWPVWRGITCAAMAVDRMTKANSPPAASDRAVSAATPVFRRISRAAVKVMAALSTISPAASPRTSTGCTARRDRLRLKPTDTKNSPSSSPLNGSMVTSTSCRYSVSASSSPATKAPTAIDNPAAAEARPAPITTSRHAATNSSWLLARATDFSMGRSSRRPTTTITTKPMAAGTTAKNSRASKPDFA